MFLDFGENRPPRGASPCPYVSNQNRDRCSGCSHTHTRGTGGRHYRDSRLETAKGGRDTKIETTNRTHNAIVDCIHHIYHTQGSIFISGCVSFLEQRFKKGVAVVVIVVVED